MKSANSPQICCRNTLRHLHVISIDGIWLNRFRILGLIYRFRRFIRHFVQYSVSTICPLYSRPISSMCMSTAWMPRKDMQALWPLVDCALYVTNDV